MTKQYKNQHEDKEMPTYETTVVIPLFCSIYLAATPKAKCITVSSTDECFMGLSNVERSIPAASLKKKKKTQDSAKKCFGHADLIFHPLLARVLTLELQGYCQPGTMQVGRAGRGMKDCKRSTSQ